MFELFSTLPIPGCNDVIYLATASYVALYSETFKMADALQATCAAPVFKRPRLEFSPCEGDTLLSFESMQPTEEFHQSSELEEDSYEVTSTSHCQLSRPERNPMIHHDLPSSNTNGVHTTSNIKSEPTVQHSEKDVTVSEPDSSNIYLHETFSRSQHHPDREADENDAEDQESTISDLSGFSDVSNLSEPTAGPISWVQRQMINGVDPRLLLKDLLPNSDAIPRYVSDHVIWRFIINLLNELSEPKRSKLSHINTLDDAVHLLRTCKKIIVLTGAGVSVSCGIPDFRSKNGIYARLSMDYPDLPDPQSMFDITYFRKDPRPFFKFAKEIYPGLFKPSPSHRFIKLLEEQQKLLRNYTQNIDTLEHAAGIKNVITCHGSFATATCTICSYTVESSVIKDEIFNQTIPYCPICPSDIDDRGIMKPDIVFFGEGLSNEFYDTLAADKEICDLLIVIGSSLKVRPVATIPSSILPSVPQILINREPLKHLSFDIELLGDCDIIIGELCQRLEAEWELDDRFPGSSLKEITTLPSSKVTLNSEVNNNASSSHWRSDLPPSEESNSCDYRGLSAIKLEDSEDGSNQEQRSPEHKDCDSQSPIDTWPSKAKDCISNRLPEKTFLFVSPNRYIFQGAEVYKDGETEGSSSPAGYSSDCESPRRLSSDDDDDPKEPDQSNGDVVTSGQSVKPNPIYRKQTSVREISRPERTAEDT